MDEGTSELLTKATVALVMLVILIYLYLQTAGPVENTNLISDKKERLDVIVSDNVPMGGFIPPTSSEGIYNEIKNDNALKDPYLKYGDSGFGPIISSTLVEWKDIQAKIPNGIKLDGYCNDTERDTCLGLNEKATNFEEDYADSSNPAERRNIDFGTAGDMKLGSGMGSSQYSVQGSVPSVFVVAPNQPAKLSVYAGARITGNKTIEKISFGVYKGTADVTENALTKIIGEQKSCYFDKNFACFKNGNDAKKCGCNEKIRYLEEPSIDLCLNFASLNKGNDANFVNGCKEGNYTRCILQGKTKCEENFPGYQKAENLEVDDPCKSIKDAWKEGCNQYFLFEKNVFSIQPPDYAIVKLGDIELNSNPDGTPYRGLAYVSANVKVAEPSPGLSCYSQKIFNDYETCCLETCKSKTGDQPGDKNRIDCTEGCTKIDPALEKCRGETTTTTASPVTTSGTDTKETCAEKYCCSTSANLENDDRYLLCKNFCSSHDAFYGDENSESQKNCTEGCDWAERMEKQYGTSEVNNLEVVFVIDTSGSMREEWKAVCDAVGTLTNDVPGYTVKSTIYSMTGGNCQQISETCSGENVETKNLPEVQCKSWGTGAEWVANNHPWQTTPSRKIIIVIGDEGPYNGGTTKDDVDSAESQDSVNKAAQAAGEKDITIFGLWGDMTDEGSNQYTAESREAIKQRFKEISAPDGFAQELSKASDITSLIVKDINRGDAFNKGYEKYVSLSKKDNRVPPDKGYYFRQAYEEVYSNLIYIVDWNKNSGPIEWKYPAEGNDFNSINLNENPTQPGEIRKKPVQPNFISDSSNIISKVN